MAGGHEVVAGRYDFMAGRNEVIAGGHEVVARKHDFMAGGTKS